MRYRHAAGGDHTTLAAGHVLRSAPGHPAFPVRLGLEILGRCLDHVPADRAATLWDPCCGSGALVTALGLGWRRHLGRVVASDVDADALVLAGRNLALLSAAGLAERGRELGSRYETYGKQVHREAVESAGRLATSLDRAGGDLPNEVARVDALDREAVGAFARRTRPDVVVTDAPYGQQTQWHATDGRLGGPEALVATLAAELDPHAVVAVVAAARRVPLPRGVRVLERLRVGHRAGVLLRAGDVD